VEFANKAESTAKQIKNTREEIITSNKDLDAQLATVQKAEEDIKVSKAKEEAEELQGKIDAAGVTNNSHTVLTLADLDVALKQYKHFIATKKDVLEKAVEHKKTPWNYFTSI